MKISIESPQKLTDEDLEIMIEIRNRKARRIVVKNVVHTKLVLFN